MEDGAVSHMKTWAKHEVLRLEALRVHMMTWGKGEAVVFEGDPGTEVQVLQFVELRSPRHEGSINPF